MKTNHWMGFAALSVLLVGMLTVGGPSSPGQPPTSQQQAPAWEYKFTEPWDYQNDYEKAFEDLGKKGWEYCEIREIPKVELQGEQKIIHVATVIIFKRPMKPTSSAPK